MIKKFIFFMMIISSNFIYCEPSKIIKRKDSVQYMNFADTGIKKDTPYNIWLYKISYPKTVPEKDAFYKKMNIFASRLLIKNKGTNIILPADLVEDIDNTRNRHPYSQENIFTKYASSLSNNEINKINSIYDIDFPADLGDIQGYLNCQVYYWLEYLGREDTYDQAIYYTEEDKNALIREAVNKRDELARPFYTIRDNSVVEITEDNKNIANIITDPIYISKALVDEIGPDNIRSNILILHTGDAPMIYKNKLTLVDGNAVHNIKDYIFSVLIDDKKDIDSAMKDIDNDDFKISRLKNFSIYQLQDQVIKRATVRENDPPRDMMIEKVDTEPAWRIDK